MLLEMIKAINERIQKGDVTQEVFEDDIFDQFEETLKDVRVEVVQKSDVDEHRWFGTQEIVFKLSITPSVQLDEFLYGEMEDEVLYVETCLVTQIYSEEMGIEDVCWSFNEFRIVYPKEKIVTVFE